MNFLLFLLFMTVALSNIVALAVFFGLLSDDEPSMALRVLYAMIIIDVSYMYYFHHIVPFNIYYYIWGYMLFAMIISPLFELFMMRFTAFDTVEKAWVTEYIDNEPVVLSNDSCTLTDVIIMAPFRMPICIAAGISYYCNDMLTSSAIKQAERRSKNGHEITHF